jgi:hypothetical protein
MTGTLVRAEPLWKAIFSAGSDFKNRASGLYFNDNLRSAIYHQFYLWMLDFLFMPFTVIVFVTIYRFPRMLREVSVRVSRKPRRDSSDVFLLLFIYQVKSQTTETAKRWACIKECFAIFGSVELLYVCVVHKPTGFSLFFFNQWTCCALSSRWRSCVPGGSPWSWGVCALHTRKTASAVLARSRGYSWRISSVISRFCSVCPLVRVCSSFLSPILHTTTSHAHKC